MQAIFANVFFFISTEITMKNSGFSGAVQVLCLRLNNHTEFRLPVAYCYSHRALSHGVMRMLVYDSLPWRHRNSWIIHRRKYERDDGEECWGGERRPLTDNHKIHASIIAEKKRRKTTEEGRKKT